jgi:drug/metabolite transporter (DMT)-like permease
MVQISDNIRGAGLMAGAMFAFTVNDTFLKAVSDELPLFQAIFLRGIGVIIAMGLMAAMMGQLKLRQSRHDWFLMILRALSELAAAYFFLTALFNMPIAAASAILQALPLTVSLAGALFLGEMLGWRRLAAILIGFVGVLLIVRPGGADFNFYSIYAVIAVGCVTFRDLIVRRMSRDVPSLLVSLIAAIAVTAGAGVACLFIDMQPLHGVAALQLGGATLFVMFGYIFSVAAMRVGDISFVAPFRYVSLLVALILGFLVFAEVPAALTLIGAGIVVATGLFTLYREARLKVKRRVVPDRIR